MSQRLKYVVFHNVMHCLTPSVIKQTAQTRTQNYENFAFNNFNCLSKYKLLLHL